MCTGNDASLKIHPPQKKNKKNSGFKSPAPNGNM